MWGPDPAPPGKNPRAKKEIIMRHVSPKLKQWLDNYNQLMKELLAKGFKQTPTNAREGLANLTRGLVTEIPEISWVQDDLVHGPRYAIPVRIYHPAPDSRLPVLVYYHGGGHMAILRFTIQFAVNWPLQPNTSSFPPITDWLRNAPIRPVSTMPTMSLKTCGQRLMGENLDIDIAFP